MISSPVVNRQISFVDLAAQQATIATEVEQAIAEVVRKTNFILGEEVERFEQSFAAFCETSYAIGVDSGTSALELALRALGIGPGDEVITAANTFIATVLAISYTGATPVLVDIDPDTYNIDVEAVEAAISPRTAAIIPVHLYGQPADMDRVIEIARRYDLFVVEDACQAHGARYKGVRAGAMSDVAAFSFYPAKNLGAYGDGGMIVTSNPETLDSLHMLRNYGQRVKYHHDLKGFNRRLDTLQAAILDVKLQYLEQWNEARRERAQLYDRLLDKERVTVPVETDCARSVYHLYVIRVADRDGLQNYLRQNGIATGVHYPVPIHLQPAYGDLGYGPGSFPVTERCAREILSLPMYPELSLESVEAVALAVNEYVARV